MKQYSEEIELYSKTMIQELLDQCTEPQKNKFSRIYHCGVEGLAPEQLETAYNQCLRTVELNKKNRRN